ncbi:MAG TPA: hypothetical protein VIL51_04125, partial [Thermoleophilia bacterium]
MLRRLSKQGMFAADASRPPNALLTSVGRQRQPDRESGANADRALDGDASTMPFRDVADDAQP